MPTACTTPWKMRSSRCITKMRSSDGLPGEWIARMKESIRTIGAAVQHAPDGQGIHGAAVPACHAGWNTA